MEIKSNHFALLYFFDIRSADWLKGKKIIDYLFKHLGDVLKIELINISSNEGYEIASNYNVSEVPFFVLLANRRIIKQYSDKHKKKTIACDIKKLINLY